MPQRGNFKFKQSRGRGKIQVPNVKTGSPTTSGKSRGSIKIGAYGKIKWTPKKATIIGIILGVPYISLIIVLYLVGLQLLAIILTGITILCGILFLVMRWVENAEL